VAPEWPWVRTGRQASCGKCLAGPALNPQGAAGYIVAFDDSCTPGHL